MKYYYAKCNKDRFMRSTRDRCFTAGESYLITRDIQVYVHKDDNNREHEITGSWERYFDMEEIDEATYKLLINL